MKEDSPKMKTGTVRTRKVGSECEFEICEESEWNEMTETQQMKTLVDAMWDSGIIDVFPNDE